MNRDTAEGKFDQVKGKMKQSVGEAFGNDKLANSGAADQVKPWPAVLFYRDRCRRRVGRPKL